MIRSADIYFSDLNEKGRAKVLWAAKVDDPKEMNWDMDILPITVFEIQHDDVSDMEEVEYYE